MFAILRIAAVVYLIFLLGGYMLQEKLIFFPEKLPKDYTFNLQSGAREIFLPTAAGNEINGLFYQQKGSNMVALYFHGNAGSLRGWQQVASDFTSRGLDLLIIDYHGYGKSTGKFSEPGFYQDALAAYEFLLSQSYRPDQIIVYGRSLGSGVAFDLASKKPIKGLVLESPFSSLLQLGKEKYRFLLPGLWARYHFDNLAKAKDLTIPVLLLHGDMDEIIPASHSEKLLRALPGTKKLVVIPGGGHNDLGSFSQYDQELDAFLNGLKQKEPLKP
ncbi:MAG: alpha/beta hydrolase [Verrucomicrobiales bacterium]